MNIEKLKKQLIIDEGRKDHIYLDTEGKPTFGVGHLLTKKDVEWQPYHALAKGGKLFVSEERIDKALESDIRIAISSCCDMFDDFSDFDEEIKQIIANMMFNMGYSRLLGFKEFRAAIESKNYKLAAKEMKDSKWYKQTKDRAKRLVARMDKFANDSLCNV